MQGEQAVVGERVQAPRARPAADQLPVLALVEERPRLLSGPRRRQEAHAPLRDFDRLGDLAEGERDFARQAFALAHRGVVPEQQALRRQRVADRGDHVVPHGLEPRGEELRDGVVAVAVHDERREAVALGVHHPPGRVRDAAPAVQRRAHHRRPPRPVHRRAFGREPAGADLRSRRVERGAEALAAPVHQSARAPAPRRPR